MEPLSAITIKELLENHDFRFSKSKGQNFLTDANIPEKIVRLSGIDKGCGVLEIGPGAGALTSHLSSAAGYVVAVELDRKLAEILSEAAAAAGNVEIVQGDILKQDIRELTAVKMPGLRLFACANLPYSITTPALTTLVNAGVFESITIMVQREVAQRLCASEGTADYGAISVFVQYHSQPRILFDVPPQCFVPMPKVYSSVVTLDMRRGKLLSPEREAVFFQVVRAAFGQRRKTLVNALFSAFGSSLSKQEISVAVQKCGFAPDVRGEVLGVQDFIRLTEHFAL